MNPYDDIEEVDELPAPARKQLAPADLELLVLAARAHGAIRVEVVDGEQWVNLHSEEGSTMFGWNPLRHSDDALTLAVTLGADLVTGGGKTDVYCKGSRLTEYHGDDAVAATRRAITRAAAEVCKKNS